MSVDIRRSGFAIAILYSRGLHPLFLLFPLLPSDSGSIFFAFWLSPGGMPSMRGNLSRFFLRFLHPHSNRSSIASDRPHGRSDRMHARIARCSSVVFRIVEKHRHHPLYNGIVFRMFAFTAAGARRRRIASGDPAAQVWNLRFSNQGRRFMSNEGMLKPALIGGVLLGILSALPLIGSFNCVCCAWVIGGGLLAARLYVKDSPSPVTLGRGATLGLLSGLIGAFVYALFTIPIFLMMKKSGINIMEQVRQRIEQWPNVTPEMREFLQNMSVPSEMGVLIFVLTMIFTLVIFCLFAMLGGTIGVALFEKRKTGAPPRDVLPYQPPEPPPPPPPTDGE
jgi:hypothetical protein